MQQCVMSHATTRYVASMFRTVFCCDVIQAKTVVIQFTLSDQSYPLAERIPQFMRLLAAGAFSCSALRLLRRWPERSITFYWLISCTSNCMVKPLFYCRNIMFTFLWLEFFIHSLTESRYLYFTFPFNKLHQMLECMFTVTFLNYRRYFAFPRFPQLIR